MSEKILDNVLIHEEKNDANSTKVTPKKKFHIDLEVSIDKFKSTINTVLKEVASGLIVLVKDKMNKPVSYLMGPTVFKHMVSNKSELMEENKELSEALDKSTSTSKLMTMQELTVAQKALLQIKHKVPFFNDCNDLELMSVLYNVQILKLVSGEKIFLQHETSKSIYYVISGTIDILIDVSDDNNERKKIAKIMPKEVFGEMAYISKKPRNATAQVSKNSDAILVAFDIKEENHKNMDYIYTKIYHNFLLSLTKKLEKSNELNII